jgi:hypothetical protein
LVSVNASWTAYSLTCSRRSILSSSISPLFPTHSPPSGKWVISSKLLQLWLQHLPCKAGSKSNGNQRVNNSARTKELANWHLAAQTNNNSTAKGQRIWCQHSRVNTSTTQAKQTLMDFDWEQDHLPQLEPYARSKSN